MLNKKNKAKLLLITMCTSLLLFIPNKILAANNNYYLSSSKYDYNISSVVSGNTDINSSIDGYGGYDKNKSEAIANTYAANGITNYDLAGSIFDINEATNSNVSGDALGSINQSGGTIQTKMTYKNTDLAQKVGSVWGDNTAAFQNYLTSQNIKTESELNGKINQIVSEKNNLMSSLSKYSKYMSNDSGDSSIGVENGVDITIFTNVIQNMQNDGVDIPDELVQQIKNFKDLTGLDVLNQYDLEKLELFSGKLYSGQDASRVLIPEKRTFYSPRRVVFTITKEDGSPFDVTMNVAKTKQLMTQYNSGIMSKLNAMGVDMPDVKQLGKGVYEINFWDSIVAANSDYETAIVNNWLFSSKDCGFIGTANFTCPKSYDNIQVKVELKVDQLRYVQKIDNVAVPTGKAGVNTGGYENSDEFKWSEYSKSFYQNQYIVVHSKDLDYKYGKVPNRTDDYEVYYKKVDGEKEKRYREKYKKPRYKSGEKYVKTQNSPLVSTDDGSYVRTILFKEQQAKYWEYEEEPLNSKNAYSEKYVYTKYLDTALCSEGKALANFNSEDDRVKGKLLTKEKSTKRLPNASIVPGEFHQKDITAKTWVWYLMPDTEIQVPAKQQTGTVRGVISDSEINAGNVKNRHEQ